MAGLIGSYTLKASPEGIQTVAKSAYDLIRLVEIDINNVQDQVNSTRNYWQGEAADSYREDCAESLESAHEWISYFRAYISELNSIAATYTGVENNLIQEVSSQLSSEVII